VAALTSVAPERNKARALATPRLFSSANQRATWRVAGTRSGDAVVLVSHGGVDVVHSHVVDPAINDGDVYRLVKAAVWLAATGWTHTANAPLAGPISLVAAEVA
jgi:hypothetical protein